MARARNLKPSFFTNDKLAEIEPLGRLLFQGLWCIADREGRLEDRPKRIKAELLPYDDCEVGKLLNQLDAHGFILRYQTTGQHYIQILAFTKHQSPHFKEGQSTIPAPDKPESSLSQEQDKHETNPERAALIVDCGLPLPDSPLPSKAKAPRLTRCPLDFQISDRVKSWAADKGHKDLEAHFEKFMSYVKTKAPKYLDWDEALMVCIRENWAKVGQGKNSPSPGWWTSEAATLAKGKELGMTPRPGEALHDFRGRINAKEGQ